MQWGKIGRGIEHGGRFVNSYRGIFHVFQLWVNLPAERKLDEAHFQDALPESLPVVEAPGARATVLLGSLDDSGLAFPWATNSDGSVVVGRSDSDLGTQAFLWTEADGMIGLGSTGSPGFFSIALDVSEDGSVVVGESDGAFIWTPTGGIQSLQVLLTNLGLDLTGWELSKATGISADGRTIAGHGTNPDGNTEAWIAVIPEPSTALLLGLGLAALSRRR